MLVSATHRLSGTNGGRASARPGTSHVPRPTTLSCGARAVACQAADNAQQVASDASCSDRRGMLRLGVSALLASAVAPAAAWAEADAAAPAAASAAAAVAGPAGSSSSTGTTTGGTTSTTGGTTRYEDDTDRFSVAVPSDWVVAEGTATGGRRTVAWYPPGASARDVNISVVITNTSVEFTKLGSFGSVATFAQNLVNSQDRSYLLRGPAWNRKQADGPIQIAKLVDYKEARGQYQVEYTIQKLPDEPQRHLLSTLALGSNGRYNRLYTLTAQCLEEELPKYKAVLQAAVNSFTANVTPLIS